jgi:hypothetical protein
MVEKIGYPDYLDDDNGTQLEKDYAEVRNKIIFFCYLSYI